MQPLQLLAHLLLVCACGATASAAALSAHEHALSHREGMALLREQLRMARADHAQLRAWLARVPAGALTGSDCGSGATARVVRTAARVQHTRHRADVWGSAARAGGGNSSTRAAAHAARCCGGVLVGSGTVQHAARRAVQLARLRVSRRQEEVAWLEQAVGECDASVELTATRGDRSSGPRATVPRPRGVLGVLPATAPHTGRVADSERQALVSLYNATNGDGWVNNRLWASPAPVCDWNGVTCNPNHTHVVSL